MRGGGGRSIAVLDSCIASKSPIVRDILNQELLLLFYLENLISAAAAAAAAHELADNARQQQAYHQNDRYASGRGQ